MSDLVSLSVLTGRHQHQVVRIPAKLLRQVNVKEDLRQIWTSFDNYRLIPIIQSTSTISDVITMWGFCVCHFLCHSAFKHLYNAYAVDNDAVLHSEWNTEFLI